MLSNETVSETANIDADAVGKNMARLREAANVSMESLAAMMRERGHQWTKITVWKIEHGDRALRFIEAADMLRCLGLNPGQSLGKLLVDDETKEIYDLIDRAETERKELREMFLALMQQHERIAEKIQERGTMTEEVRLRLARALRETDPGSMLTDLSSLCLSRPEAVDKEEASPEVDETLTKPRKPQQYSEMDEA